MVTCISKIILYPDQGLYNLRQLRLPHLKWAFQSSGIIDIRCLERVKFPIDCSASQSPESSHPAPRPHDTKPLASNAHISSSLRHQTPWPQVSDTQGEGGSLTSSNHISGRTTGWMFPVCLEIREIKQVRSFVRVPQVRQPWTCYSTTTRSAWSWGMGISWWEATWQSDNIFLNENFMSSMWWVLPGT